MKRTPIIVAPDEFPQEYHTLLQGAPVYDSSCSPAAKVYFIDRDGGYYLKRSSKDSLCTEARLTEYFHEKGFATEVLSYLSNEQDWFLTRRVAGEDCTHSVYLDDPKRLCETTATLLRQLHETDFSNCPVDDRISTYCKTAEANHRKGLYDPSLFPEGWGFKNAEEAWAIVEQNRKYLKSDTLLHGDYCLPNVVLDDWKFSGFIDLGNGGVGDRHIDLFWGAWTLFYNLKTDAYCDRFLDAYGRDKIEEEMLRAIAAFEVFG